MNKAAVAQVSNKSIPNSKISQFAANLGLCQYKTVLADKRLCVLEVKAQQAQESGNFEEAIELFQDAYSYANKHIFWEKFWGTFWGKANYRTAMQWKRDGLSEQLGDVYYKLHRYHKAIDKYKEASTFISEHSEADLRLVGLYTKHSRVLYNIGNFKSADQEAQKALKIIETVINSSEYAKRSYNSQFIPVGASVISDQYQELYTLLQNIKIKTNQAEKALEYSERGRSLGLISLLSVKDDPFSQFQTPNYDIGRLRDVAKSQKATLIEYSIIDNKTLYIYVIQPSGAFHFRIVALDTLDEIRKNLYKKAYDPYHIVSIILLILALGIGILSVRIENNMGRGRFSWTLIVIALLVVAGLIIMQSHISIYRAYQKLAQIISRHNKLAPEKDQFSFGKFTKETLTVIRGREARETPTGFTKQSCNDDNECLRILYQILIKPIESLLPKDPNQHIIFFPQKDLYRIPFAALKSSDGRYLVEDHTIRIFSSIQSLDILGKRQASDYKTVHKALVVGNPMVPKNGLINTAIGKELRNLPFAEKEAISIGKILGTKPIIGPEATEDNILNQIRQAKIIHFATHATLDAQVSRPNVSIRFNQDNILPREKFLHENVLRTYPKKLSAIVLTPSQKEDGLLDEVEIYDLKRLNADLVVLSACNSGLGDITTDGVINLARPFISNGVPSVVVSLWSVYDDKTAEFMIEFYHHLGRTPDKAQSLRQAMLRMIKNKYNPVDWAGFVLVGEPYSFRQPTSTIKPKSSRSKELTIEALKNATYRPSSPASVKLINGKYYSKGNSIGGHSIWLGETIIREDLNRDGAKDAIVVIHENTGGTGVFMELAIVINNNGKPIHAESFSLGDRVRISDVRIDPKGHITLTVTQMWGQIRKMSFQLKERDKVKHKEIPRINQKSANRSSWPWRASEMQL